MIRVILADFAGLLRVCGFGVALRWLAMIALNFKSCMRARNLQPADRAMGSGPFPVKRGGARAKVFGEQVLSGTREIWVRDVYLDHGWLTIPADGVVVDLGANMGNFTVLALAHGPQVRCVSVEGDPRCIEKLQANINANGWLGRAEICTKFIGGKTVAQEKLERDIGGDASPYISEDDFIRQYNLHKIDLLKCDIEGSEFALLTPSSRLLQMSEQIAVETHPWGGDVHAFVRMLEEQGFVVHTRDEGDIIAQARRRARSATIPSTAAAPSESLPVQTQASPA